MERTMKKDKIKFISRSVLFIGIFLILTLLIVALPGYIFLKGKEGYSIDRVIELQNSGSELFLYGKAYSNDQSLYKLRLVNSKECEVIALGTSRVMQFRSGFFNKSFCNAGGGIYNIRDFENFLKNIDEKNRPKLLIVGLDQYFFHERWTDSQQNFVEKNKISILSSKVFNIYIDFLKGKIDMEKLKSGSQHKIGINAIMKDNGFRSDGSYFYGEIIKKNDTVKDKTKDSMFFINNSQGRFIQDAMFSEKSKEELDLFLKYAHDNNIQVIGFLPPYAIDVWKEISYKKERYEYMFMIEEKIRTIFEKYDYEIYDFSDLRKINASDCEIIDGFHASDKAHLRMIISIAEGNSIINRYADSGYLKRELENSKDCFLTK
jgi:uncharacterized protein YneR